MGYRLKGQRNVNEGYTASLSDEEKNRNWKKTRSAFEAVAHLFRILDAV